MRRKRRKEMGKEDKKVSRLFVVRLVVAQEGAFVWQKIDLTTRCIITRAKRSQSRP